MSYNIDHWTTKECDFRIPMALLEDEEDWELTPGRDGTLRAESSWCESGYLVGTVKGRWLTVGDVQWSGSGSGHSFDLLLVTLRTSLGRLVAILQWEGGSIERLEMTDGVVVRTPIEL